MSHMAPSDEHKSQLLIILGATLFFLSIVLLLSSLAREASSFGEAGPTPNKSPRASKAHETTSAPTPTPTAHIVALPEVQGAAATTEIRPTDTLPPTATSSPTPSPSVTASPAALPSATSAPGLRRPTRVPRPTP